MDGPLPRASRAGTSVAFSTACPATHLEASWCDVTAIRRVALAQVQMLQMPKSGQAVHVCIRRARSSQNLFKNAKVNTFKTGKPLKVNLPPLLQQLESSNEQVLKFSTCLPLETPDAVFHAFFRSKNELRNTKVLGQSSSCCRQQRRTSPRRGAIQRASEYPCLSSYRGQECLP